MDPGELINYFGGMLCCFSLPVLFYGNMVSVFRQFYFIFSLVSEQSSSIMVISVYLANYILLYYARLPS